MNTMCRLAVAFVGCAVVLTACAPPGVGPQTGPGSHDFTITIYDDSWSSLRLGYEADTAQRILTGPMEAEPLYTLSLDDIASYNWTAQIFTLTPAATQALTKALENATYGQQSALIDFYESVDFGNPLDRALYTKAFVVAIDGERVYGGIFLDMYSQMAIDYPVMRIWEHEGAARLALLPTHLPFALTDDPTSRFTTDNTAVFRDLIRDDRVRELFESLDRLVVEVDPHNA